MSERPQAPPRARKGLTPLKAVQAELLQSRRESWMLRQHRDLLASIGGGLLTWRSSPHLLWLAFQLAGQA